MPGRAVSDTAELLKSRNISVIKHTTLQMPESFPPYIAKNMTFAGSPAIKEMESFKAFAASLKALTKQPAELKYEAKKVSAGFWGRLISPPKAAKIIKNFGVLSCDTNRCNDCGICVEVCPSGAVSGTVSVEFSMEKCSFCYSCFNNCPQSAISTDKLSADYRYSGPADTLKEKFV